MQAFPHHYQVVAAADNVATHVNLSSQGVESLVSAPPAEFGGPGDKWSPESLLVAAVADCFVLSFRSVASASGLPWLALRCEVDGVLDRQDRVTQFTAFTVNASLTVGPDIEEGQARRILEKAERSCLITNSLLGTTHLNATIVRQ
ncbi:MAG: organic hydroperoxide reductase OsmC/OhrA [Cyclobacteriaceae bacterium]|jgi:organic hydroperoxide reductase OsmC/OhrA